MEVKLQCKKTAIKVKSSSTKNLYKVQTKPSSLQRGHPAFQTCNIFIFFSFNGHCAHQDPKACTQLNSNTNTNNLFTSFPDGTITYVSMKNVNNMTQM